ncbi:hypothetical protein [Salinactinospora qingdaonensis]|uniref:hypothetical protein n=1 Tax=Salinactinospora qingdaonensis TaxID=702744 RepID=UPI0031E5665A
MTLPTYLDLPTLPQYLQQQHGITGHDGSPLSEATVRGYHNHASQRRRDGCPRPGDFPPPDQTFGRSPVWLPETIDRWATNRPGRGTGGGRPRKHPKNK